MARRKKPPSLEELLCDKSFSNLELLSDLQQWKQHADSDESDSFRKRLLGSEAARQALAGRIIQGCHDCKAFAAAADASAQAELLQEHLAVLGQLAMLMPAALSPEEPAGDKLARVLLHGSELLDAFEALVSCINTLCEQCSSWPSSPEVDSVLASVGQVGREVLSVVQDMACYAYTATHLSHTQLAGTQGKASMQTFGRERCGAVLLGTLMDLAAMDISLSKRFYALRRSAVSSLVAMCSHSRRNQINLIEKHVDAYNTLMGQILPACGDVQTQIDLFETMYRVGKTFTERAYKQHMNAQMRGKFAELLAMDTAQLGDLRECLHNLVVDYNSSQNNPSVHHVHAHSIQILSPLQGALRPLGSEVALGVGHLGLEVEIADQGGAYPETCDIEYTNVTRVMVQPVGRPDGAVQLQADILCKPFPPALGPEVEQQARQQANGKNPWFKLGMLLETEEANKLMRVLQTHDVTVVNQSNNLAEPSQPEVKLRKVSMGNLPQSYKPKVPLNLTKTTPATDNKMKPLALFKTPQTAAAAMAAAAPEADAEPQDVADDEQLESADADDGVAEEQQPSPEFGAAPAPVAAAGAAIPDLAAVTPVPEGAHADGAREEQMLQALLQTVQEMPNQHTGTRPTLSGSLMAGPSPEPAAGPTMVPATAATWDDEGEDEAARVGKETAPAAALAAAGDTKQQQQKKKKKQTSGRGKQQQQEQQGEKGLGADSVSWGADEDGGDKEGDGVQQDETLQSNSQDPPLEDSPAAAAKARRRGKTTAPAAPAAAVPDNQGARKGAGKQAAATAKPESAPAARPPAGTNKPPDGKGRKAADRKAPAGGLYLDRRSKRKQAAKETQDPIQDPDLPSLPPPGHKASAAAAPAAAAREQPAAEMPAWLNNTSTAAAAGAAASAPVNKVTNPYSSRTARQAASTAAAGAADAGDSVVASPGSGGRKKASRLAKLGATPQGKGKAPAAAAAAHKQGQRAAAAAAAEDAGAGELYAFPDEDAAEAAAEDAVHDAFPDKAAAAGGAKGQKGHQAADRGGGASGKGRKAAAAAAAAADTAAAGEQQQQEPVLSGFDFPVSDDSDAENDINDNRAGRGGKGGRGAKGRGRGRGRGAAAAAKAGTKRKAAAAGGAAGNRQKQQRRGAAAAEAAADAAGDREDGDVVYGTVDDDTVPASDLLNLNLDSQPDADAADAAATAAAAVGKKQRKQKQQGGEGQGASLSPGAARRQPRASKSKALEAMQQQQRVLDQPTQADLLQDDFGFGDLQNEPLDQQNEEEDGAADGGDMFGDQADAWGGLGAVPQSPGAHSGSGGAKGAVSDSSDDDDDDDDVAQLQALLQGAPKPTTHGRQLARLLQRAQPPAAAAGTPDSQKIHTAQVARKLALTAAATKGGANKRKQAAAAAAGALGSPVNGTTAAAGKRKAGAAAQDGFQLPGLGADGFSPNVPDLDAAGANDMATGFNLDLTRSRRPGKGFGGLKGLGLGPAAADDDSDDEEAAAATRFGGLAANGRKPQRRGAFADVDVFGEDVAAGFGGGLEGSEQNAAQVAHLMAKALIDDDDDDNSDSDDEDEQNLVESMLLKVLNSKKAADARRHQQAIQNEVASLGEQIAEMQAEMKKDFSTLATKANSHTEKMLAQLEAQAAELQAIYERAQQQLQEQWQGYREVYEKACAMQQTLRAATERGRTVYKRKVADLQQTAVGRFQALDQDYAAKRARTDAHFKQMAIMLKAAQ